MVSNKVKFKVSIKELVFEYEGDNERAQILQGRITETLGSLAAAQADAIDITPARQLPAAPSVGIPPKKRRRSRKPAVDGDGTASTTSDDGAGAVSLDEDKASRKRRPRGSSYRGQVANLLNGGFFKEKRTGEEVRDELIRVGHNFPMNRINDALLALTQKHKLSRTTNAHSVWEYENGATA
jgi:hypothetical protein